MTASTPFTIPFEKLSRGDVPVVGGKNSSLGEMIQALGGAGCRFRPASPPPRRPIGRSLRPTSLTKLIAATLAELKAGKASLAKAGAKIREAFISAEWPAPMAKEIVEAYRTLCRRSGGTDAAVAVRSSATAEDLPDASFAGQQDTFLNIHGEAALLDACKRCYASLFTDRAISYRIAKGFDHMKVALSVGVQRMVRSDLGGAGVMFSIDTETGFSKVVLINAAWGLGEMVVQGAVDPDEYEVFKPLLKTPALVPIVKRRIGGKAKKMIYADAGPSPTRIIATTAKERAAPVLSDPEILQLAKLGLHHRGSLRPAHGHGVGQGRRDGRDLHRPGPARDRAVAPGRGRLQALPHALQGQAAGLGHRHRRRGGVGSRLQDRQSPRDRQVHRRLGAGHRIHRPGLGADHEAGRRHRHRSRRAHLPRRHRQPRAGPARHRRRRERHQGAERAARDHRVLRRGRRGLRL